MRTETAVTAFAALAHPVRLEIFRLLVKAGPSGMAAGEIASRLEIGATSASFHLKELGHSGLVRQWRDGRYVRYAIQVEDVRRLLLFLTEDCCQGQPELCGDLAACGPELCKDDGAEN